MKQDWPIIFVAYAGGLFASAPAAWIFVQREPTPWEIVWCCVTVGTCVAVWRWIKRSERTATP